MNEQSPPEIDLKEVDKAILKEAQRNLDPNIPILRDLYHMIFDHPFIWCWSTIGFHLLSEYLALRQFGHITEKLMDVQNPSNLEMITWIGYTVGIPAILGGLISWYQKRNGRNYEDYTNMLHQEYVAEVQMLLHDRENSVSE